MSTCNKPASHRTDQAGQVVCAEHASLIKAGGDDAPLVYGLDAEAKRGQLCTYAAPPEEEVTPEEVGDPDPMASLDGDPATT